MIILDKFYKSIYESFMKNVKIAKLDCWNLKAPEGYVSNSEKEVIKEAEEKNLYSESCGCETDGCTPLCETHQNHYKDLLNFD